MRLSSTTALLVFCVPIAGACADPIYEEPGASPRVGVPADNPLPAPAVAGWPAILVNEVLPANDSVSTDEALDFDDWAELYNASSEPVSLAGWGLADDPEDPDWTFPDDVVLEPGAHLVVWLDEEPEEGPLHATFSLAAAGDELYVFAPDGAVVDGITWLNQPDDVVVGRFPSGGVFRTSSILATPGNGNPLDPGLSLDPSDALFPPDDVIRLDLYVDEDAWRTLMDDDYAAVPASLGFEGAFLADIELRIKGGIGSRRDFDEKSAFRLNLDTRVPGQRLRGLEHLTLNNMVQDDSGVHELLAYQLLRDGGVPAPRIAHVELWLNGAYRGLYLNVETPDDQFLQRWFADATGNLYEGVYGQDLEPEDVWSLDLDEQGASDPTDRSELADLAAFLAQPPSELLMPELEARVDLERTLDALAGEVLLGHWDGYFYFPNNYRVYHEPTADQWTLIPSGMDQTFASEDDVHDASGVLAQWCLAVPSCRTRYDLALWEMAEHMLDLDCATRVDAALDRIVPLYAIDLLKEGTVSDMLGGAEDTVAFCESYPLEILADLFPSGVP